ncbi:hypothetical protein C8K44_114132 [Aminobacter sp. AP02]|nr:hypothetical protein C8K44_114132 [Aminobacter sp. AP02]
MERGLHRHRARRANQAKHLAFVVVKVDNRQETPSNCLRMELDLRFSNRDLRTRYVPDSGPTSG